jgi:hypothetical protein
MVPTLLRQFAMSSWISIIVGVVIVSTFTGCALPKDARGTLSRVTGGEMKVGVVHAPPWVIDDGHDVGGIEGTFVRTLASELPSRVVWVRRPESLLMKSLERGDLDLVIGGLTDDLPWKTTVAFTRPHHEARENGTRVRHVLAAPAGENAWLVRIEQQIVKDGAQ